jgi:hypothetical protein
MLNTKLPAAFIGTLKNGAKYILQLLDYGWIVEDPKGHVNERC